MIEPPITIDLPQPALKRPQGMARWLLKTPLLVYRLGLGRLMPPTLLILTTTGRHSGQPHRAVLETRRHGSKQYIVSLWGRRADWYRNLVDHPLVRVQVAGRDFPACAQPIASPDELWRVLRLFRKSNPLVDAILENMTGFHAHASPADLRDAHDRLTGVRLDPAASEDAPPGVRPDLAWVWGALLAVLGALITLALWQRRARRRP